jgi:hypothetical protein
MNTGENNRETHGGKKKRRYGPSSGSGIRTFIEEKVYVIENNVTKNHMH